MLIRAAIAVTDKKIAQELTNRMISFSLRRTYREEEIEFDFSYYSDLPAVLSHSKSLDMVILSYSLLEKYRDLLPALYKENPTAFSIPMGSPDGKVCDFLALRPAGHLSAPEDQAQLDRLCLWCAEMMMDNPDVLQLSTRQGCYAITASSILFCQSDQKYVMLVTDSGEVFRKLDKLDHLTLLLPDYFIRTHQSFLVNARRISGLDRSSWEILLDSGQKVPVSRAYKKTISEQIQKFLYSSQK